MVDFRKKLVGKHTEKVIDPVKLYETLDRAHDKGPLRPAQEAVLCEWFQRSGASRDMIIKLHTGQGKTLVGLLLLQANLNASKGRSLYLCPNNFLVLQTCEQARQFGIPTCIADRDLPEEFLSAEKILVTSVQKLFNGCTQFGLDLKSQVVGTFLIDDAHACADRIRESCRIRIPHGEPAYDALRTLFADPLERQGAGTFAEISRGEYEALLPVPYWAWLQHETDVVNILVGSAERQYLKFVWPLLKNMIGGCQCVISGKAIEIEPRIPPLSKFGSYWTAPHRIFMSATVTDDAFLVKGLQLAPETITNPITFANEGWSGEKMVLLPSLIHDELDRAGVVKALGTPSEKRRFGYVALAPSFSATKDWAGYGAAVAKTETLEATLDKLRTGRYEETVVLVNRYDGIDLPDDMCRILVFDGMPYSESLVDLYEESCRPASDTTLVRTIRTVEQGLGRSVRGEKDYSVIIIIGTDVVRLVRNRESREFLSPQMSRQIEIGLQLTDMAKQEIDSGEKPGRSLYGLIGQCLNRDDGWKAFYAEQMEGVTPAGANGHVLDLYAMELKAELAYDGGDCAKAAGILQELLDRVKTSAEDRGWYLQEMARYQFPLNRHESDRLQIAAHKGNRFLLKPASGVTVAKLTVVTQGRVERIKAWMKNFDDYGQLNVSLADILGRLVFGTKADRFERALDELSRALGFAGERPDKEWKEGPDNLWALDDTRYIVWECKDEVATGRIPINKHESEQMNRSSAWFEKYYPWASAKRVIVHPGDEVESAGAFTHDVEVMGVRELGKLVRAVREFFKSFEVAEFRDLSAIQIQNTLNTHKLAVDDLLNLYTKKVRNRK